MPGFSNVEARKKWVAEKSIEKQIVAGWLDMFGYDLPPEEGADWARYLNEEMLRGVRDLPFLVPLATVPMQSGKCAAVVLREALSAGCHGAMIGTQPRGATGVLDDPDLDPFWEAASELGATIFVHPTFGARDDRLKQYGLVSAVGRVTDTSIAVARLLYSGHLIRYPGVKLVLSHGGAALPMLLGRLKRSFATAPADNFDPEPAFRKLYFDSVVYDPVTLRFVAEQAGADKIMMGTDHPFSIGESDPIGFIDSCNFTPAQRAAVVGGTARIIFKI
jgi:aminocarboxymuconate-semialdehyde decarboxylase